MESKFVQITSSTPERNMVPTLHALDENGFVWYYSRESYDEEGDISTKAEWIRLTNRKHIPDD